MLTADDVESASRVILLHGAGSQESIDHWISVCPDAKSLQRAFLNCKEFKLQQNRDNIIDRDALRLDAQATHELVLQNFRTGPAIDHQPGASCSAGLSRALGAIAAHAKPRTVVVFGGAEQEVLALELARSAPHQAMSLISNARPLTAEQEAGVNDVSSPPLRLPLAPIALLECLSAMKIVVDVSIIAAGTDWPVVETAYEYGHRAAIVVYGPVKEDDDVTRMLDVLVPPHMGEVIRIDDYLFSLNMDFPAKAEYAPTQAEPIVRGEEKIALAAIVKDEEEMIEKMLRSCAGVVDFVALLDTGCTDDTCEIAHRVLAELGIPYIIHEKPFVNFAAARNDAIALIPEHIQWTLMLDADEYLVEEDKQKLLELARHPEIDAWSLPRYNFVKADLLGEGFAYADRQARLFKTGAGYNPYYINAVHEALVGVRRMGAAPANSVALGGGVGGPHIHHAGAFKSAKKLTVRVAQNYQLADEYGLVT